MYVHYHLLYAFRYSWMTVFYECLTNKSMEHAQNGAYKYIGQICTRWRRGVVYKAWQVGSLYWSGGRLFSLRLCSSGFQDLLRLNPPSLLMLLGCISIQWLIWWDDQCTRFWWRGVWCLVVWWCGPDWNCVQPPLICQVGPVWCVSHVLWCGAG